LEPNDQTTIVFDVSNFQLPLKFTLFGWNP
jgi:hypothetical protein